MKRISIALSASLVFAAAGVAQAATISLAPSAVSVTVGQSFTVAVSIDAGGAKISTVKSVITYPQDFLIPVSFAFNAGAPAWIPLSQPGYDQMSGGTIIKTAGFPGGFTGVKELGVITFTAKAAGSASVAVSDQSLAYDAQSHNTLSGTQGQATIVIAAPAPQLVQKPAPQQQSQQTTHRATQTSAPSSAAQSASAAEAVGTSSSLTLAAATSASSTAGNGQLAAAASVSNLAWAWIVFGVLVLLGLGWWFLRRPSRF